MTLFFCCLFSLRHCRVGSPKPYVVYRCTMSILIVSCRVAPKVRPILIKSCNPASLITAAKRNTFFRILFRKLLVTYSLSFCYFSWWRTTAIPHWLDYVTESEVDITALLFIGLTACRRFLHLQLGKLWLSLDQRQTSPRFLLHCARPSSFSLACGVHLCCIKATNYFCEHYTLQTVLIHTLFILPKHRLLFTINYIQHTNH